MKLLPTTKEILIPSFDLQVCEPGVPESARLLYGER